MNSVFRVLIFLFTFSILSFQILKSQEISITKFYDSTWTPVSQASAFYFCNYEKRNDLYLCQCFWNSTQKLKTISMRNKISWLSKKSGIEVTYFKNGKVESTTSYDENGIRISNYHYFENGQLTDSIFYNEMDEIDSAFHYYINGKLKAFYFFDIKNKKGLLTAYDSSGEKISKTPYLVEAHYKNGEKDWISYIKQNLNPLIAIENNAPRGTYQVFVRFTIEKNGTISEIKPQTKYGYGMEEHVVNILKKSPKWNPEVFLGEPRSVFRYQPVTFVVDE